MSNITEAQKEYFKNSQARNKDGSLIKCYRFSNNTQFDTFDKNRIGKNNKDDMGYMGKGFYFSADKEYAKVYGRMYCEVYLNITEPLILDQVIDFEKVEILEYLRDNHPEYGQPGGPTPIVLTVEEAREQGIDLDKDSVITLSNFTTQDILLGSLKEYAPQIAEYMRENGYDGVMDHAPWDDEPITEFMVLEPNQIKSVHNLYPTQEDNFIDNAQNYVATHKNLSIKERVDILKYKNEKAWQFVDAQQDMSGKPVFREEEKKHRLAVKEER